MIRKYQETDCEAVVGIWFAASRIATPFLSGRFMMEERHNIRTIWLKQAETWVFDVDGTVVGFISLIGSEVGAIFVDPNCQGRGIGRALMDHAANLRGQLFLDVFEENAVGRRFYDRYGFRFERKHVHEQTGNILIRLSYRPDENASLTHTD